jgi:lysophospholipase
LAFFSSGVLPPSEREKPLRSLTLKAPDGRHLRAGTWDLPEGAEKRAVCVLLQGHTEFLEKYQEVAGELNARGYVVASVDWRSQGASERQRRIYGNRKAHVGNFEEYDIDLSILINQVVAPMGLPVIALAHSMGAHILLRYLHEHRRRFVCATLTAPMLDVHMSGYPPWQVDLALLMVNLRRPSGRFLPGMEERDQMTWPFEANLLTSDPVRYRRMQDLMRAQPFLRTNGPTFGWLGAAVNSMRRMQRPGFAERIETPLLIAGAGKDRIVRVEATREFVKKLPDARYVEFEDAQHEILMEADGVRARFWAEFDAFTDAQLAKGVAPVFGFAARARADSAR